VGTNSSLNTAWISRCTAWASQGETVTNRCQLRTTLWSITGLSTDGPPKAKAIGSTLLRPSAKASVADRVFGQIQNGSPRGGADGGANGNGKPQRTAAGGANGNGAPEKASGGANGGASAEIGGGANGNGEPEQADGGATGNGEAQKIGDGGAVGAQGSADEKGTHAEST